MMKWTAFLMAVGLTAALCFWSLTGHGTSDLKFTEVTATTGTTNSGTHFSPNSNLNMASSGGPHRPIPINGNAVANPYQYILEVFASIPSGTSLDQAQFDSALGVDAGNFLRSLNVVHVDSLNNTVKVKLSAPYTNSMNGAEIRLGLLVQFTFRVDATGTLICDPVAGIDVKANSLLGWMPVKHVEVSHDTAGNTIIEVEVSTFLGTVKRVIRLDPTGKPIP